MGIGLEPHLLRIVGQVWAASWALAWHLERLAGTDWGKGLRLVVELGAG
jgi:hypothetical protein